MQERKAYDIIGIGIGPFNLGLAALCYSVPELNCLFIDQNKDFNWHPGLMIPGTRLQVPFYADLITLADPCSPFSYMAFLKATKRMFRFAILEDYFIQRTQYNEYCRWVANQLSSLQFCTHCKAINYNHENAVYEIQTNRETLYARHIVTGIGSVPHIPSCIEIRHPLLFHSADYLYSKEQLLKQKRITIIGSGQSAAEIFYDLLQSHQGELYWFTRSERFSPMDYSKFVLEMTSPDYIDHFYSLPENIKPVVLSKQNNLYKGINSSLIDDIYSMLREKESPLVHLHPNCELRSVTSQFALVFMHTELQTSFQHQSDAVILATGYKPAAPGFLSPIRHLLQKTNRNYSIDTNNTIFVQNAELHTHGFNAADLGLGPYRNAIILNTILSYEHFEMEKNIAFQAFGLP